MLIVMADLRCGILLDVKTRARAVLATASGTHFVHDGFSDILYVLLPVWAQEFRLNLTQVGLIRTAYTAAMASFQIPAGLLAERWGERRLLAAGTALTACGFIAVGAWAGGFASLLILLLIAGLGSGVQHPLSSSLVSKAYETGARRAALGTYNFSGDLGKVAVPAAVAFAATVVGWRAAAAGYGVLGLVAALVIVLLLTRLATGGASEPAARAPGYAANGWGIRDARGFQALSAIGMIDNATRTGLLTFLPFALIAKGSTVAGLGSALARVRALLHALGRRLVVRADRVRAPRRRGRRGTDPHGRRARRAGDDPALPGAPHVGRRARARLIEVGGSERRSPRHPPPVTRGDLAKEPVAPAAPALERQQRASSMKSAPGTGFVVYGAISTKPSAR